MLSQLVSYTQQKGLLAEPGFTTKEIRWLVGVSPQGAFTELIPLENQAKTAPDLSQPDMMSLPGYLRGQGHPVEQAAHFLADTCAVVFGLAERDANGQVKRPDEHAKNLQKQATFRLLIQLAANDVPLLKPIAQALSDPAQMQLILQKLEAQTQKKGAEKLKPTDKVSFWLQGQCVLDFPDWRDWWRRFRAQAFPKPDAEGRMPSFASGALVTPASTHPKVTRLGGSAFGHALVTYDKEAFESYGLSQGENAAVEEQAANAYRAGLDALLEKAETLGEMKVVVWYDREIPKEDDFFKDLFAPVTDEAQELQALERAHQVLQALRTGQAPPELRSARFFAAAMSPASGRVMLRDWQMGQLEDFVAAVEAWFTDLAIVRRDGQGPASLPGLNRLFLSLQRPKTPEQNFDDYLKPIKQLQTPLWRAALNPRLPIPYAAVAKIMETHTAEVMTGAFTEALKAQKPDAAALGRIYARMGLLKAYHNRKGGYRMSAELDLSHPSPAYHCGRLMCLLAQIQEAASESEINAGVIQRYYGAASSTPSLVLGRLTRLSQHHLAKMAKDAPGLAYWFNTQLAEVWKALGKNLPRTLSLEEQSLFALGYYQQMAASRKKETPQTQAPSAP
ncbi:type I-C CRISPR-associated protein Cas8c/Csd1 [Meiothermus ruber]|uniref:CRISPR-associated protein, Csd1 family n=1 Tax=Meiothermus ruber (strain ATCC 35948 / DSM 1279 / VKM B-1258 / 21) TaxID=504728 RepID=D3PS16_MEIRD|nr:type I-C CRISPR-associated protein Cas8c/Csd1 [Meiothermus ruber]ADD28249.1 CRISPR-associated protein, Csd1 family [Meiothermus ruber DSM 1279]AGK06311.1 Csd1 family CRISPR-associated protein [Meiothermus ruber DSM 1279]MCL6531205.1 type I-C CRISPR-associated protein Cas8c/Csd1 [Meiothermus ruber]GAO75192.1 Csd1 family CRISPR-associated protein [Meiothermus ruber H328]